MPLVGLAISDSLLGHPKSDDLDALKQDLPLFSLRLFSRYSMESVSLCFGDQESVNTASWQMESQRFGAILTGRSDGLKAIRMRQLPRFFRFFVALSLLLLNLWCRVKWCHQFASERCPRQVLYHLLAFARWRLWLWEMIKQRLGYSWTITILSRA